MLVALAFLLVAHPARSQDAHGAPPQPTPAATPTQAQQALDILQDDRKRAQLIQTLQTIAKASPPAASTPAAPSPVPADNLGVQLLVQVSDWFGDVSGQLAAAARNLSDFPMIWRWLVQLATDPIARQTLLDTA
jgi:moderate conductance mechanosensitive channel